jgi:hypothetical protein
MLFLAVADNAGASCSCFYHLPALLIAPPDDDVDKARRYWQTPAGGRRYRLHAKFDQIRNTGMNELCGRVVGGIRRSVAIRLAKRKGIQNHVAEARQTGGRAQRSAKAISASFSTPARPSVTDPSARSRTVFTAAGKRLRTCRCRWRRSPSAGKTAATSDYVNDQENADRQIHAPFPDDVVATSASSPIRKRYSKKA